jgi:phosphate transport system substrate-binding protein
MLELCSLVENAVDGLVMDGKWGASQIAGRCINRDYCSLSDERRDILVPKNAEFVCPECGRPLRASLTSGSPGRAVRMFAFGAAAAMFAGGASYAGYKYYRLSGSSWPAGSQTKVAGKTIAPPPAKVSQPVTKTVEATTAAVAPTPATPTPAAAAVAAHAVPTPAVATQAGARILLHIAGSDSLNADLVPKLAQAYLVSLGNNGVQAATEADEIRITSSHFDDQEAISIVARYPSAWAAALRDGQIDLSLSSGQIDPALLTSLRKPGDPSSPFSEHVLAVDAAAVIVSPQNVIATLTVAQLRGILDGSLKTWGQLGATSNGPIHLVFPNDGSAQDLASLVPGAQVVPADATLSGNVAASVAADPDALALVHPAMAGTNREISVDAGISAVAPTAAAIQHGDYPLARKLYLYTQANGANQAAERFIHFAMAPEGQAVLSAAGLMPNAAAPEAAPAPAASLTPMDQYRQLLTSATRLDADLHFESKSNRLDLHSARAIDRIWNFMFSYHNPPDHLVLVGFADNQGTPEKNLALSAQRAEAVAALFKQRGLPPGLVLNLGADLPVADNSTEAGREKNRRVEVFLRN